jgi:diguanylate cyclase (GGDEF)-like protein
MLARTGSTLDVATIDADLLDQSMQLFGADRGAVFLHEPDGAAIVHRSFGLSDAYLATIPSLSAGSWLRTLIDGGQPTAITRWGADLNDPDREQHRREAVAEGFVSVASAPLMADGVPQGALVLYHDRARRYGRRDLERLRLLGERAGVAIRNALDYAQMARWAAQLHSIQQLGVRLSRLGSVREVGDAIAEELEELIEYHNVRVYRLLSQEDLVPVSVRGRVGEYVDETPEQLVTRMGAGLTGWVAQHREALLVHDAAHDLRGSTIPGTHAGLEESMLLAPMLFEGEVLGVLVLSKLGLRQFTPDDLRLLEIYASFAAQAMANVDATERLREQSAALERQLRSQQVLLQITESILTTLETRRVLDQVARGLAALVRYDALAISEVDPSSGCLRTLVRVGPDPDRSGPQDLSDPGGISAWVARENEPQLVPDVHQDPRARASSDPGPERSLIAVPLRGRRGSIGVLTLERLDDRNRFGPEEFDLVKLFGAQVSIALQNAEEHRQVEIRAETDALTGLRNKGAFDRALAHAVDSGESFSLLMVDLDDFKAVNDARGHQAGDDVLRRISQALRAAVRETDGVYRYGGDEFALLLSGTDARGAAAVADKVSQAVRLASTTGVKARTSCSIGIASCPDDGADGSRLVLAADRACYAAKRGGPGRTATAREGLALASEFTLTSHTPVDDHCAAAS